MNNALSKLREYQVPSGTTNTETEVGCNGREVVQMKMLPWDNNGIHDE